MADDNQLLEKVLRDCRAKAPAPFYPSTDGKDKYDRAALDSALDRLRLGGLLQFTDWVAGHGQGYALTSAGAEVLQSPRLLSRLQTHGVEPRREEAHPAPSGNDGGPMTPWERGEAVRAILTGPRRPTVTIILISLCVGMFFLGMNIAGERGIPAGVYLEGKSQAVGAVIRDIGAINRPSVVVQHEWWRMIAHQFLHYGAIHILLNMFFLYNVGQIVEVMWGHIRFLFLFLISGIGGGCAVVMYQAGSAAGASGALCGIFASLAVWIIWNRRYLPPQMVASSLRQLMLNAVIIALISTMSDVSWQGHLGGAIAGAVVSAPLMFTRFGNSWQRWLGWLGVIAVPVACVLLIEGSTTAADRTELAALLDNREAAAALDEMQDAVSRAADAYNQVTVPLLKNPEKVLDDSKRLAQAQKSLASSLKELQSAAAKLEAAKPSMPANRREVATARDFVASWQGILTMTDKALEAKEISAERGHEIAEQITKMKGNELFRRYFSK